MIRSVIPSESRGIPLRKLKGNLNEIPRLGSGGKVEASALVTLQLLTLACDGIRKTAAQRNAKIATPPVHSQKPRCQKTECRREFRIGPAHDGSSRVSSNNASLPNNPISGIRVTSDQIQNTVAAVEF